MIEEIKWQQMISNLRVAGLSYIEISMLTGFTSAEIAQMHKGDYEPPYLQIIKLLDLHLDACPTRHNMVGIKCPEELI
jgi:predicted transcriptional regulator